MGRFRNHLVEHDLWERLLGEISRQLEAKNIILTEGRINIIDATPIEAAQSGSGKGKDGQPKRDKQAGWHVKKDSRGNLKSTYGYSVHTGVDEDGFIQRQTVTASMTVLSAIRSCWAMRPPFTPLSGMQGMPCRSMDAAYSSKETRDKLERFGIADQVQRKGYRNKPLSRDDSKRNDEIAVIRAGGERPFATYKSRHGLARTRFMGLAKNMTAYGIAAIAHNVRKGAKFLTLYGLPDPTCAG